MKFLRQYIEAMIDIDDNDGAKLTALFSKKEYVKGDMNTSQPKRSTSSYKK